MEELTIVSVDRGVARRPAGLALTFYLLCTIVSALVTLIPTCYRHGREHKMLAKSQEQSDCRAEGFYWT